MPKPAANTVSALTWPAGIGRSGRSMRVDPGIEGVVQIHAGRVEQRQRDQQRQGPRIERAGRPPAGCRPACWSRRSAGWRRGRAGARPASSCPQLVQDPGELARDRAGDARPRGSARAARPRCRSRPRGAARSAPAGAAPGSRRRKSCVVEKSCSWSRKIGTWKCTRHSAPWLASRVASACGRSRWRVSRPSCARDHLVQVDRLVERPQLPAGLGPDARRS